jgi:geranylgeranyl pyrophosphate synthase
MRTAIQTVIADGSYARVSRSSLLASLDESGALALAQERAIEYAEAARASLDGLNGSAHAAALRSIPTYIVERDR